MPDDKVFPDASETPSSHDAQQLAMSITNHPLVAGAIVVVLCRDGELRVGAGMINNPDVIEALSKIAKALKEHCDTEWKTVKKSTGVFAGEADQN